MGGKRKATKDTLGEDNPKGTKLLKKEDDTVS